MPARNRRSHSGPRALSSAPGGGVVSRAEEQRLQMQLLGMGRSMGIVLLLIPLAMLGGLVEERQARGQEVAADIARSSAGPQDLVGPLLLVEARVLAVGAVVTHHEDVTLGHHVVARQLALVGQTRGCGGVARFAHGRTIGEPRTPI